MPDVCFKPLYYIFALCLSTGDGPDKNLKDEFR